MKKIITKKIAIQAIIKEELTFDCAFFNGKVYNESSKTCNVCAVGAILRKASITNIYCTAFAADLATKEFLRKKSLLTNTAGYTDIKDASIHLTFKNYLAALSCVFETTNSKEICLSFITQYFPEKFEIEI